MPDLSSLLINTETATQQAPANAAGASAVSSPFADIINAYTPNRTANFITSDTDLINDIRDPKNYDEYDVSLNRFDTEAELDRERAENQSAIEQFMRGTVQVGSEVILGSVKGMSDIVDALYSLVDGEDNDYHNAVSDQIQSWQDSIREAYEIYQTDPNAAWSIGDSGWWFNNAVSFGSTLSLLVPGMAVGKVGKLLGLGKLGRTIGKAVGTPLNKGARFGAYGEQAAQTLTQAAAMRTAENYMEARDVYDNILQLNNDFWSTATDKQKQDFFDRHPELRGKSTDEIGRYLAGEEADDTFAADFALMLMDAWQLRALKGMFSKSPTQRASSSLRNANLNAARRLTGREAESLSTVKKIRDFVVPSLSTAGAELSEGVEEFWQYTAARMNEDDAKKMYDDNYNVRGLEDFVTDPHALEQAFWGWLGGVAFQGLGSAANQAYNRFIAKNKNSTDQGRKAEIEGRIATINTFNDRMRMLNNNIDPDTYKDENDYQTIDDETRDIRKDIEIEKFVTDLTINAANSGNLDLLRSFVTTDDFQQAMGNSGTFTADESAAFNQSILSKIDNVYNKYTEEVNKVAAQDIENPGIIYDIARTNTYAKIASERQQRIVDAYDAEIAKGINDLTSEKDKQEVTQSLAVLDYYNLKHNIELIERQKEAVDKRDDINDIDKKLQKRRLDEYRDYLLEQAGYETLDTFNAAEQSMTMDEIQANNNISIRDGNILNKAKAKNIAKMNKYLADKNIYDTNQKIKDRAKYLENQFKIISNEAFAKAVQDLTDIFDSNDTRQVVNQIINHNSNLSDAVKNKLDTFAKEYELFAPTSDPITEFVSSMADAADKRKANKPTATVNGEGTKTKPKNVDNVPPATPANAEDLTGGNQNGTDPASSSTGGQPQDTDEIGDGVRTDKSKTKTPTATPRSRVTNPDEAAAEQFRPPVGDETNPDAAEEKAIADAAATFKSELQIEETFNKVVSDFVFTNRNSNKEQITAELLDKGVPQYYIDDYLDTRITNYERLRTIADSNTDIDLLAESSISDIVDTILSTDEQRRNRAIKFLIDRYILENGITQVQGNTLISIPELIRYIMTTENGIGNDYFAAYEIYKVIRDTFQNNNKTVEGYSVLNKRTLNLTRGELINIVETYNTPKLDRNTNVGIPSDVTPEALALLNVIEQGEKLDVFADSGGVQFLYKGYKVGFNRLPGVDDFGHYSFKAYNTPIYYTIWRDANGDVRSSLDNILDDITGVNGKPNINILTMMNLVYTSEFRTVQDLANDNNLIKQLKAFSQTVDGQRLIKAMTGTNAFNDNVAFQCLEYLNRLYYYSDFASLDKCRESCNDFLRKQLSNYEFTTKVWNAAKAGKPVSITVDYVSRGGIIQGQDNIDIDEGLANYDKTNYDLAFALERGIITNATDGTTTSLQGFARGSNMIVIPNGSNAPTYIPINRMAVNGTEFGNLVKAEVNSIITDFLLGNTTFEETSNKLMNIFGIQNFVDGVNCVEYQDRILISTNDPNVNAPIITLYKYRNDGVTRGRGISANYEGRLGHENSWEGIDSTKQKIVDGLVERIFQNAIFSVSYPLASKGTVQNYSNQYFTNNDDGTISVTMNGVTKTYRNYLDFLAKEKLGKINIGKRIINDGGRLLESNFSNSPDNRKNIQLKVYYGFDNVRASSNPKATNVESELAKGNRTKVDTIEFLNRIAEGYDINKSDAMIKSLFPKNIDIITDPILLPEDNNVDENTRERNKRTNEYRKSVNENADAYYNRRTKRIVLTRKFFDTASKDAGQYNAVRILLHENIHRKLAVGSNLPSTDDGNRSFKTNVQLQQEIQSIFDEFVDKLSNANVINTLREYAIQQGYNPDSYIKILNKLVDWSDNGPYARQKESLSDKDFRTYCLEEFVVESITNKYLNEALNLIEANEVNEQHQTQSLWAKIVNWIRNLFGLGDINQNSLLQKELDALSRKFKPNAIDSSVEQTKEKDVKPTDVQEQEISKEQIEEEAGLLPEAEKTEVNKAENDKKDDDNIPKESESFEMLDDEYSAFSSYSEVPDRLIVPDMTSASVGLNPVEQTEFAHSLDTGAINFACL